MASGFASQRVQSHTVRTEMARSPIACRAEVPLDGQSTQRISWRSVRAEQARRIVQEPQQRVRFRYRRRCTRTGCDDTTCTETLWGSERTMERKDSMCGKIAQKVCLDLAVSLERSCTDASVGHIECTFASPWGSHFRSKTPGSRTLDKAV